MTSVETPQPEPAPALAPAKKRWPARLARVAAAIAGGLLLYASFPPRPLWFLALPGLALYGWSLHGRRLRAGFVLGLLGGLAFLLAGRILPPGESVAHPSGWRLESVAADDRKMHRLRLHAPEPVESEVA